MTRIIHDQYAKQYLAGLFERIGQIETTREISPEPLYADLYFTPKKVSKDKIKTLGLLGQIGKMGACLLEVFRNQPTNDEIRTCQQKLYALHNQLQRQQAKLAKQDDSQPESLEEEALPHLWILTTSASDRLLDDLGATLKQPAWCEGVYLCPKMSKTAIIAINRLPITKETLFIRLLGKGKTQQQAISEIQAFPENDPIRNETLELLLVWRIFIETKDPKTTDEEELLMNLSPIYQQWRESTLQEGRQEVFDQQREWREKTLQEGRQEVFDQQREFVENLLSTRFGELDESLSRVVKPLLQLSPKESSHLLLQESREELLARFSH